MSPLLVTSQDCAQQNVSTVLGVDDLNPPANTPHRVDVIYDPRFLWPTTDADWQARAQGIAKTIRDRADLTLEMAQERGLAPAGCFDLPNSGVDDGDYIKFTNGLRLKKGTNFDPGRAQNGIYQIPQVGVCVDSSGAVTKYRS